MNACKILSNDSKKEWSFFYSSILERKSNERNIPSVILFVLCHSMCENQKEISKFSNSPAFRLNARMSMEINISETIQKCNFNEVESKNYGYKLREKSYSNF